MSWSMGLRQFLADFLVAGYQLAGLSLTRRPDALSFDYRWSACFGPVALGDSSQGTVVRAWYARTEGTTVYLARANDTNDGWEPETVLFEFTGEPILEIDLAFEQAGRAVIVAERPTGAGGAAEVWLYWYDPTLEPVADFVFENKGPGMVPRVVLDDVENPEDADIQVVYLKPGTGLVRLEQRNRYQTEYPSPLTNITSRYIEDFVMTVGRRLRVEGSLHDPTTGTYTRWVLESLLYPVYLEPDQVGLSAHFLSAELRLDAILHDLYDPDQLALAATFLSAALVESLIVHDLYDKDELALAAAFLSATLVQTVIVHDLYDMDELTLAATFLSATLVTSIIVHTLFDTDNLGLGATFQSAVLEEAA